MGSPGDDASDEEPYCRGMGRRTGSRGFLLEQAAIARIEELRRQATQDAVTTHERTKSMAFEPDRPSSAAARRMWALGDYHRFATETVWPLGRRLVDACGIMPGQRVLDVAAGTGNVAIRAAQAGAHVVASDLTPEHFEAGRQAAAADGVGLEWVEADAESLPFPDGHFDVVTSCLGAIFAPNHAAAASEMLRVCRPGGVIGMVNFKPEGLAADFFALLGRFAPPPPPGASPPLLWGDRAHVRALFADSVESIQMTDGQYVERSVGGPDAYRALFETTFGPVIAIRASLAVDPERLATFEGDFREFSLRGNRGAPGRAAEYPFRYLLVLARKRAS
jgi:2-polyprenyl-6-hydroxyphenyl methylase/3-demethylubiquinone-9 3-methyltransferase